MNRHHTLNRTARAIGSVLLLGLLSASVASAQSSAPNPGPKTTPLRARVRLEKKARELVLLGRKDGAVLYSLPGTTGVVMTAKLQDITHARIKLDYDRNALDQALGKKGLGHGRNNPLQSSQPVAAIPRH